jgi:predicted GNAT family acetyltransferase
MHVEHDTITHRFLAQVPSGTAVLAYAPVGPGLLELYSTYVPAPDRGRGTGGHLVEAALSYAREQGMLVIPTCWYVAQWIREHPESADLLATRSS